MRHTETYDWFVYMVDIIGAYDLAKEIYLWFGVDKMTECLCDIANTWDIELDKADIDD